ncbi:hypothetical protein FRC09_012196 [Ceratobasidium sp. 395]|nr:hypothetical protein FRC09_012196 [Ceratobasidium sp. 395]
MFTSRKPAYTYNSPPLPRPPPIFPPSPPKPPRTPNNSPTRGGFRFPPTIPSAPFGPRPPSPPIPRPRTNIFNDPAFANYQPGFGFPPTSSSFPSAPSGSPPSASTSNYLEASTGTSTSPLRANNRLHPILGLSAAERAKVRAARARASARVDEGFQKARDRAREEHWRKTRDEEFAKRLEQEEARKLTEEICMRAEIDRQRRVKEEAERKKTVVDRWTAYVGEWERITKLPADLPVHERLTARHLPCPMFTPPPSSIGVPGITRAGIEAFIMDPAHSEGKSRRERVRAALLIWHPDKVGQWIFKFRKNRHKIIREVVDVVSRHLIEMMAA